MQTEQSTDPEFSWIAEYGGPVVSWNAAHPTRRHDVAGDGLVGWFASGDLDPDSRPLRLCKHIQEANGLRMLTLGLYANAVLDAGPVYWDSTLKVGDGRYVRSRGSSSDFPTALMLVEAHSHESRQIGGLTWWCNSETEWVSWVGPFHLSAKKMAFPDRDPYWRFEFSGEVPTFEEAALLASFGRI